MNLLILLSLAGLGAAFMALMPEDSPDGPRDDVAPDDDTPKDPDDDTPKDPDDDGASIIRGTDQADNLEASGNLTARGFGGNDTLEGEDQSVLYGDEGNDVLYPINDAVGFGGAGADKFYAEDRSAGHGGEGNDTLYLYDAATGFGHDGDDVFYLMDGTTAYGGDGNDTLSLWLDMKAKLYGDSGNDVLTYSNTETGRVAPFLLGGDGDDTLHSAYNGMDYEGMYNPDSAIFAGGSGNDLIQISAGGVASGGAGNDTIIGFSDTHLSGGAGNDLFVARSLAFGEFEGPYIYDDTTPQLGDIVDLSGETITITDFTKGEDRLQIDFGGTTPNSVALADNGTDTTVTAVFDDGIDDPFTSIILVKRVTGLTFDDISFSNGAGAAMTVINGKGVYAFTSGSPLTV